jgi:predicted Zn-dependent protease
MSSRADTFRKFIAARPDDPFPRYSLAMELKNHGNKEEARTTFVELEQKFPDYIPQYLMHANLLTEMGQRDEAIAVLRRGIPVAARKGDGHASGEMQSALAALE